MGRPDEDAGIRPIFFATVCPLNGNRSRKKERKILLFILVTSKREGRRKEKLRDGWIALNWNLDGLNPRRIIFFLRRSKHSVFLSFCAGRNEITMICSRILFALMNFV